MFRTSVFAPRLGTSPLPTGATALEVQQDVNHHSRYDVSQRKRRNVPQEVFHGVPPFSGGAPHKNAAYTVSLLKARAPQRSRHSFRLSDGAFVFAGGYGVQEEEEAVNVSSPPFLCFCHQRPAPAWGEMLIALVAVAPSHFFNKFIVPLERSPYGIVREAIF